MRFFYRLVLLLLVLLIAACGNNPPALPTLEPSPTVIPTTTPIATQASAAPILPTVDPNSTPGTVRIIHAAADTPVINVSAGFFTVATNLDFTQATEPTPLDAGEYNIEIMPSGSRPGDAPLFETTYTLKSGAADILVLAKQDGQFQLLSFPETTVPLNADESAVTIINAISGASSVNIRRDGADVVNPLTFGQTATSGILPTGATTLSIETGGGIATPYEIELEEQRDYTLVLTGQSDRVSIASYSRPAPGRATVRAVNALEANEPIDIYLDGNLFAQGIEFARPTDRQNMISGQYTISAYAAGADRTTTDPLLTQTIALESGENNALIFIGTLNRSVVVPIAEDLSPTPPGKARISFLNTLESVSTLRVETSAGPLAEVVDASFGETPGQALLDASSYSFYLTRSGASEENRTVETVDNVQFEQGNYYLYLVTGQQDNQPVILSDDIGVDETLTGDAQEDLNTDRLENPVELRFINAIADQTIVDFRVNNQIVASAIGYGQGSELIPIEQTNGTIEALAAGSGDFLQGSENVLESGSRYTVVAYGMDGSSVRMTVIPDDELVFDGRSPYIRLINLSPNTDTLLEIGFSPQDPTPLSGIPEPPNEDIRRSIPAGIQRLAGNVQGGARSSIILMPTGIYDLEIIDSNTDQLATTFNNVPLEAGVHSDVFVYEESDTTRIRGFVLAYPTNSGD